MTLVFQCILVVQSLSHVQLFVTPWTVACQASLSFTISWSLLKLLSIELVMPSSHLILVIPFSSCPQSLPASESFPMSQLFTWGGQSTGVSSFFPKNTQDWSPSGWTGWISLQSKGFTRVFSNTTVQHSSTASILQHSAFFMVQLSHPYITTRKTAALTRQTLEGNIMFLLFNMLSRWSKLFFQGASAF